MNPPTPRTSPAPTPVYLSYLIHYLRRTGTNWSSENRNAVVNYILSKVKHVA